jgi:microcystin-dependent protein
MAEAFIAEVRMFGFNFAPRGWADCNGQLLSIAQNTALFSLVGVNYGGNGQTTFGLPNLQGRAALAPGQGPGLSNYALGQTGGVENVTLTAAQVPAHNHTMPTFTALADTNEPAGGVVARVGTAAYINAAPNTALATSLASAGGGQAHNNMMPSLVVRFCISLQGIFPSRP